MSDIIFPIRRVDGGVVTGGGGAISTNPTFESLVVTGDVLKINNIEYSWPSVDGLAGQVLTTDGNNPATLTFSNPPAGNISHRREDADTNTYADVDIAGTGLDNTIRFASNTTEVYTVTQNTTSINNNASMGEGVKTTMNAVSTPLNYTANFGPVHDIRDSYMYFASGTDLVIVDIGNPTVISTTNLGFSDPAAIKLNGKYAYVAEGDPNSTNSYIIDISNPIAPSLAGTFNQQNVRDIQIQGGVMYTSDFSSSTTDTMSISFRWIKQNVSINNTTNFPSHIDARNNVVGSFGLFLDNTVSGFDQEISFDAITLTKPINTVGRFFLAQQDPDGNYDWAVQNEGSATVLPSINGAGGTNGARGKRLRIDSSGNSIVAFDTQTTGATTGTIVLAPLPNVIIQPGTTINHWIISKMNPIGTAWLWSTLTEQEFHIESMALDSNDDIYVVGDYTGGPLTLGALTPLSWTSGDESFLAKMSKDGVWLWSLTLPDPNRIVGDIVIDSNDYIILIQSFTTGTGNIRKYNSNGVSQWSQTITTNQTSTSIVRNVDVDSNNNIYVSGIQGGTVITAGPFTISTGDLTFITKLDPLGNYLYLVDANLTSTSLAVNSNGAIIVGGGGYTADLDATIHSFDNEGNLVNFVFGGGSVGVNIFKDEAITNITIDENDRIYAAFSQKAITATWPVIDVTTTNYSTNAATTVGGMMQINNQERRFKISSLANPINPILISETPVASNPTVDSLLLSGKHLFIVGSVSGDQSISSYDNSDISNPILLQKLTINTITDDYVYTNLVPYGNYIFAQSVNKSAVAHPHGIVSINVNDVSAMVVSDTYTLSSSISGTAFHNNTLKIQGNYLYFVEPVDGVLTILNISDPTTMTLHTTIPLNNPIGISIIGKYLYVMESPNTTLTIYNYMSSSIQHLDTGTMITGDVNVGGDFVTSSNIDVSNGITVARGLTSQGVSSIGGTLTVGGNIQQSSGSLTRSTRQITGAGPTTTLDQDYILTTAHTGTATLNLLLAEDNPGVNYQIIKENGNLVNIVAPSTNIIVDQLVPTGLNINFNSVRQTATLNIASNIQPHDLVVDSINGFTYTTGVWGPGASVRFGPDSAAVTVENNTNLDNSTWISKQSIPVGIYTQFINIPGNADNGSGPTNMTQDSSGDLILLSMASNQGAGSTLTFGGTVLTFGGPAIYEPWLAKMNTSGVWQWAIKYTYPGVNIHPADLTTDSDNNIYILGNFTSATYTLGALPALNRIGNQDLYLAKLDSTGTFIDAINIGLISTTSIAANIIINPTDNSIYVTYKNVSLVNVITVNKYDSSFNFIWTVEFSSLTDVNPYNLKILSDGDIIISGSYSDTITLVTNTTITLTTPNITDEWIFVARVDSSGIGRWVISPSLTSTITTSVISDVFTVVDNNDNILVTSNYSPGNLVLGTLPTLTNSNGASIQDSYTATIRSDGVFTDVISANNTVDNGPTAKGGDLYTLTNNVYYTYETPDNADSIFGAYATSNEGLGFNYVTTVEIEPTNISTNTISMTGATNERYTMFSNGISWFKY